MCLDLTSVGEEHHLGSLVLEELQDIAGQLVDTDEGDSRIPYIYIS